MHKAVENSKATNGEEWGPPFVYWNITIINIGLTPFAPGTFDLYFRMAMITCYKQPVPLEDEAIDLVRGTCVTQLPVAYNRI